MISRQNSLQIKGVAILCMIAFHLYGFPERLPDNVNIWWLGTPMIKALQICVPIYLFMSGYGLQCNSLEHGISWKKIVSKIKKIYILYWTTILPFIVGGILIGYYHVDSIYGVENLLFNVLGVKSTYNGEWWFFSLYIELLVLFFFISRINVSLKSYICVMIITLILCRMMNKVFTFDEYTVIGRHLKMIIINVNIFMMGCFFSKYNIYEHIDKNICRYVKNKIVMSFVFILLPLIVRAYVPLIGITELVVVPMFALGVAYLCRNIYLAKVLSFMGKHSMTLWLIHTFFIYYYLNEITFLVNSAAYMFAVVLTLSLCSSLIINLIKNNAFSNN